jgi:hypothetical protein
MTHWDHLYSTLILITQSTLIVFAKTFYELFGSFHVIRKNKIDVRHAITLFIVQKINIFMIGKIIPKIKDNIIKRFKH